MASVSDLNNVKIFVLYLMRNVNYPLDRATINDIVMQSEYVLYLDFAEAFPQLIESDLIRAVGENERGEPLYEVTRRGATVAESLKSDILPVILDKSLENALRYLDLRARGIVADCESHKLADNTFDVTLLLKEKGKLIYSVTVNVDSEYRSLAIRRAFMDRPDVIYRSTLALLCGKVNYLFDK